MKINKEVRKSIKNKKFNHTITFNIWSYFILLTIIIFIVLWSMQVLFLQTYYSMMKKKETENIAKMIEKTYILDKEATEKIEEIAYRNLVNVLVIDLNGKEIYNSINFQFKREGKIIRPVVIPINDILKEVKENNGEVLKTVINLDKYKSQIFVYGKTIKETNTYLIVAASIDPIDSTVNVLKQQLVYITIIILIISSIISMFISKKIAKPIVKINDNAKKLAKGIYNVEFEKVGYVEIDNLADTLNYATKELEKTDNLRRELIANVSHDLKTPLTMIKAYSEMIKDLDIDNKEKSIENLNVIIEETDRLTKLVNDMLDLSKLESKQINLNFEKVNLTEMCNKIVNMFLIIPENKDFKINVESIQDVYINADKSKMEQVIYNLLSNAINYSKENKDILIRIEQSNDKTKFMIKDKGEGISEENIKYIWDKYYKADKSYRRTSKGTGLRIINSEKYIRTS